MLHTGNASASHLKTEEGWKRQWKPKSISYVASASIPIILGKRYNAANVAAYLYEGRRRLIRFGSSDYYMYSKGGELESVLEHLVGCPIKEDWQVLASRAIATSVLEMIKQRKTGGELETLKQALEGIWGCVLPKERVITIAYFLCEQKM